MPRLYAFWLTPSPLCAITGCLMHTFLTNFHALLQFRAQAIKWKYYSSATRPLVGVHATSSTVCRPKTSQAGFLSVWGGGMRSQMMDQIGDLKPFLRYGSSMVDPGLNFPMKYCMWNFLAVPVFEGVPEWSVRRRPSCSCHVADCKVCLVQGQRAVNKKDAACFWWSLYIMVSLHSTLACQPARAAKPLALLSCAATCAEGRDMKCVFLSLWNPSIYTCHLTWLF